MNNKSKKSATSTFVIDKTPPTVVITGIEESSYRADERENDDQPVRQYGS